eukprot:TRINITY_DN11362_c0_g1_i1.p1 TRINITY_DN11362_c0_g1~~TRINITY_DN11362_c0_g1_i1.p1  ORF type:complete len:287 (-),score=50.05 TRINITY_DN11362_c0_g1_i1:102-905(-)
MAASSSGAVGGLVLFLLLVHGARCQEAGIDSRAALPPVLASRFHMNFQEYTHGLKPWGPGVINNGSFHYDFREDGNHNCLWSHGKGQSDNWCQCADFGVGEQCDILSLAETKTTVAMFKTLQPPRCCTIGDWAHGFGPLRPDWLVNTNATLVGVKQIGDRTCYEWASPHPGDWFTIVSDNWSLDAKGLPCTYEDRFNGVFKALGLAHKIIFDEKSYDTSPEDLFKVPGDLDCSEPCANKKGWCQASKIPTSTLAAGRASTERNIFLI